MTIREKILGLIAGIACIVAVVAVLDDVATRKSRDRYKEWGESVKGLLWYVPDEQWGTYAKERLKKDGNKPYDQNDAMTRFLPVHLRFRLHDPQAHIESPFMKNRFSRGHAKSSDVPARRMRDELCAVPEWGSDRNSGTGELLFGMSPEIWRHVPPTIMDG